jgi:hypothetical protein
MLDHNNSFAGNQASKGNNSISSCQNFVTTLSNKINTPMTRQPILGWTIEPRTELGWLNRPTPLVDGVCWDGLE